MDKRELLEAFLTSLSKMKRQIEQQSNTSVEERMATMLQIHSLDFIAENPLSTPSQVAGFLCLSSSSTAQLIDRLITSSWIKRVPDEYDRRIVHLELTDSGKKQLQDLKKRRAERFSPILTHVPKRDLEELVRIMDTISIAFEKGGNK